MTRHSLTSILFSFVNHNYPNLWGKTEKECFEGLVYMEIIGSKCQLKQKYGNEFRYL